MEDIFIKVLNMSITASYVIIAIMLIRLLLKKAPKKYSYALWAVAAFRLCCPVSFKSVFSIFNLKMFEFKESTSGGVSMDYVPENIGMTAQPEINTGFATANSVINDVLPAATPQYSANPMQVILGVAAIVWSVGMAVLLTYGIVSYIRIRRNMATAVIMEGNVWQSDKVRSPFILGFIRPRIYIPFGLGKRELSYVLAHERYHIKRLDYLIKPLAYLMLIVHWFNPLCWVAFNLMGRDMEMSCDEKVLGREENILKAYSTTLLSFATNKRFPTPSPLAFSETAVKGRIKNVLNFRKPKLWISMVAVVICIVAAMGCAANPADKNSKSPFGHEYKVTDIVYDAPQYSFTYTDDTAPHFILTDDKMLGINTNNPHESSNNWDYVPVEAENIVLDKDNFDSLFIDADGVNGWLADSSSELREDNETAWKYLFDEMLYYVLQQKNGDVYLGLGYDNEYGSSIRWLFKLENIEEAATDANNSEKESFLVEETASAELTEAKGASATQIFEQAKKGGYVVFDNSDICAGQDIWDDFLAKTEAGESVSVNLAYYYTLDDPSRYEKEYYEEIKDDYPVIYRQALCYDGENYILKGIDNGHVYEEHWKYLVRYEGKPSSATALFKKYVYYVLVNDNTVTWEELEWGMFSSQLGDYIAHNRVYTDWTYE